MLAKLLVILYGLIYPRCWVHVDLKGISGAACQACGMSEKATTPHWPTHMTDAESDSAEEDRLYKEPFVFMAACKKEGVR